MNPYFDDEHTDAPNDTAAGAHADSHSAPQQEGQSPLLLQDMQTPEEMYALPKKSQRPRQLFVAVAVLLGAVGAIFAMRQFGMGPAVSLAGVDMDYKPGTSADSTLPRKVLEDLERSRRAVQVPEDKITQDPFELEHAAAPADTTPVVDPDLERKAEAERQRQAALARQKAIDDAFKKLKLEGVMGGKVPVARIDGKLYKVGMTIGEHFTVDAIVGREVTLSSGAKTYTLTMDSGR